MKSSSCHIAGAAFYIKGNSSVDKKDVKVIQNKLKQYVPDFHQNIFFVEKAKKDEIKSEFIKL